MIRTSQLPGLLVGGGISGADGLSPATQFRGRIRALRGRLIRQLALGAATACFFATCASASSFTIDPIFDSSITSDPNHAAIENTIDTAISVYESLFYNPVTIYITFTETSSGLGESSFNLYSIPYTDFYSALEDQSTSANLSTALSYLPNATDNPVTNTPDMVMKPANVLALGLGSLIAFSPTSSAGTVSLNTSITTPGSSGSSDQYSLLAVTEHEIDEVLGLGSTLGLNLSSPYDNYPSPEDLYRFSAPGVRSFTLSSTATAYFSIDDGNTNLVYFNNTGSGDYGDWASSGTVRVQDAFATPGSSPTLGPDEIAALNVIGYDTTPEPATWWLLATGICLIAVKRYWPARRSRYTEPE